MKKVKILFCLLPLSSQVLAFHPNFADTIKSKEQLITELAAQADAATIYEQQCYRFLTLAAIELVIIIVLLVIVFLRKRSAK